LKGHRKPVLYFELNTLSLHANGKDNGYFLGNFIGVQVENLLGEVSMETFGQHGQQNVGESGAINVMFDDFHRGQEATIVFGFEVITNNLEGIVK
jgi:hypothetical protein